MDLKSVNAGSTTAAPSLRGALSAALKAGSADAGTKALETEDANETGEYTGGGDETDRGDFHDADDPDAWVTADDVQDLDAAADESGEGESTEGDAEEQADEQTEAEQEQPATAEAVEEVEITDHKGRRSIKVDFNDRAKLKRYIQRAAGFEKAQAEHKQALEAAQSELSTVKGDADLGRSVTDAWKQSGIDGLIRLLTEGKQSWDSLYQERAKLEGWKAQATPEQLAAYNAGLDAERAKREAADAKAEIEAHRAKLADEAKQADAKKVQAEQTALQTAMNTAMSKFGFSGKLKDAAREARLDKQVFLAVQASLDELPDDTVVDQALINRLWKEETDAQRTTVETEVRKETGKVLNAKSREAKSAAQTAMRSATPKPSNDVSKQIEQGGIKRALRAALVRARG